MWRKEKFTTMPSDGKTRWDEIIRLVLLPKKMKE
jgi:hypothetical protein